MKGPDVLLYLDDGKLGAMLDQRGFQTRCRLWFQGWTVRPLEPRGPSAEPNPFNGTRSALRGTICLMARRTRKPWNASKVLFPELHGLPPEPLRAPPEGVTVTPSTGLVMSPRKSDPKPDEPGAKK